MVMSMELFNEDDESQEPGKIGPGVFLVKDLNTFKAAMENIRDSIKPTEERDHYVTFCSFWASQLSRKGYL